MSMRFPGYIFIAALALSLSATASAGAATAKKICSFDACYKSCMARGGGGGASNQGEHCSKGCAKKVCKNGALAS
jgi:hypothetical protein